MNDRPEASDLLAAARDAFNERILPALPSALRYDGLMIANALGIVLREIQAGDAPARAEYERLGELLPEGRPETPAARALHALLEDYNRRLSAAIRAGRFDGAERAALRDHLQKTTHEKLAISNPKLLK
jgi:hypothetical protein